MANYWDRDFPRLIELIGNAALDASLWQAFLDALCVPFGGANGVLYSYDIATGYSDFHFNFGLDPSYLKSYLGHYRHLNPYPLLALKLRPGHVVPATAAAEIDVLHHTEFFQDWMKPQGIPADHLSSLLHNNGGQHAVIGLAPQATMYARHRERYTEQFQALIPHITRSLRINQVLAAADRTERLLDDVLDKYSAAVLIIAHRKIVRTNLRGEQLFRNGVLRLDRNGIVYAARPNDDSRLEAAIGQVTSLPGSPSLGPLSLTSTHDGTAYWVWLVRLTSRHGGQEHQANRHASAGDQPVMMVVSQADRGLAISPIVLRNAFQLSAAEAELASALARGLSVNDYATQAGLSRNTVRNQLASVFEKTQTSRQSELMVKILMFVRWMAE
jgi:DNA-binding CsgD family transcriptional regulator